MNVRNVFYVLFIMPPASVMTFLEKKGHNLCWADLITVTCYVVPPKSVVLKLCSISDFQIFYEHISFMMKSVKIRF